MQALAKRRGFKGRQLLLDKNATAAAVSGAIADAAEALVKGDLLLLTYSGHAAR